MSNCQYNFNEGERIYTVQVVTVVDRKSKQFSISKSSKNLSVAEVLEVLHEFCTVELPKQLNQRLFFDYVKKKNSHCVSVILWNETRTNAVEHRSFYINYPQYTSLEIATILAEYLLCKKVDWKTRP